MKRIHLVKNHAEVGDSIVLRIPKVDRGPLDPQNILGKVLENDEIHQISTNHGILKNWFSSNDFIISGLKFSGDIPKKNSYFSARQWP